MAKDPNDQFQIGDRVIYEPEGVLAEITGYVWNHESGALPSITAYKLNVGIEVPAAGIRRDPDATIVPSRDEDFDRMIDAEHPNEP